MSSVLHLIRKIRDQHSSCTALFMTPISHSIKSDKMETESKSASHHSKNIFLVNIKIVSTKEVNLSTKRHRHIPRSVKKWEIIKKTSLKQYWDTLFKSSLKHLQNMELNLQSLFEHQYKNIHPPTKYSNRGDSPLVLVIPNYFCDNLKPAMLQISKPLTSNLVECAICKPVFSITTCNLICQFNFNIYKSSHWKWNVFMLRKNHIGPLPRILLIRSWIPFLLTI